MGRTVKCTWIGLLAMAAVTLAGCGGAGSGSESGSGLSQSQAETLAQHLSMAAAGGSLGARLRADPGSNALVEAPEGTVSCTQTSCIFNESTSYTLTCDGGAGGRMGVTGSVSGTMNNSGTGYLSLQMTETLTDWACDGPELINGDPYISLTGQFSYTNGQPSPTQHLTLSGGVKGQSWNCQLNLTINFGTTGHGDISGTVCGYQVYSSF